MEITFKFRVEILIMIIIVWAILWGHLFCSCSKEGFQLTQNRLLNETIGKVRV